jgi:hypothetical protein
VLAEENWHFVGSDNQRYGPYGLAGLRQCIALGYVNAETLVWAPYMGSQWTRASQVQGLMPAVAPLMPPLPGEAPPLQPPVATFAAGYQPAGVAVAARPAAAYPRVPSHMVFAIVSMVALLLPAGVVALMYASKVDALASRGELDAARANSRKARRWCWLAFSIGVAQMAVTLVWLVVHLAAL